MRDCAHTYNELALDLIDCGDTDALTHLWAIAEEHGAVDPMTFYYKAAALNSRHDRSGKGHIGRCRRVFPQPTRGYRRSSICHRQQ